GYSDYSEWFIGHSGSTYWRKKESEKAKLFRKIEPYLTFLNIHQLERQGADIQSKVQELEDLNSSLRERDKVKDDAIAYYQINFWLYPQDYNNLNENNNWYNFYNQTKPLVASSYSFSSAKSYSMKLEDNHQQYFFNCCDKNYRINQIYAGN
ncbi:MAG: hypothetical protein ACJ71G_04200, partial [Nitrososphaeraceae archaeon]